MMKNIFALLAFAFSASAVHAATVAFTNLNGDGDAGYGVRSSSGVLVTTAGGYTGILGTFSGTDSSIINNFNAGNTAAIASAFTAFDPVGGNFDLDNINGQPGLFDASESFDTRTSASTLGGATIYAVFYKGSSLATSTELFIAKLNEVFPTDPNTGAALVGNATLSPTGVNTVLVGSTGASHDYGYGGGALPTYQLSTVGAVPEPSKTIILAIGLFGFLARRRRQRA